MIVVNSVCGCAAGRMRPAVRMALEHSIRPDQHLTPSLPVRMGRHPSAPAPTSPDIHRRLPPSVSCATASSLYMLQRSQIENPRSPRDCRRSHKRLQPTLRQVRRHIARWRRLVREPPMTGMPRDLRSDACLLSTESSSTGARQIWEMKSCGRLHFDLSGVPRNLKASTELAAAQSDDGVCALYAPVHACTLQPGTDHYFTAGLPRRRSKCRSLVGETSDIAYGIDSSRCSGYIPGPLCIGPA